MNYSGIYKIQSKKNPKRIYIGSAVNIRRRWNYHREDLRKNKHANKKLQNHFNKYGETDLILEVLMSCKKDDLLIYEQFFIDAYNPYFNICRKAGSCIGITHSEEAKQKMREAAKNRKPVSEETRNKMRLSALKSGIRPPVCPGQKNMLGKHHSEEARLKMSIAHKGRKHSPEHIEKLKIARNKREPFSEETKRKISISRKGHEAWNKGRVNVYSEVTLSKMRNRKFSDEHRKNISESQKGRLHSIETKRKMSLSHKGKNITLEHRENLKKAWKKMLCGSAS